MRATTEIPRISKSPDKSVYPDQGFLNQALAELASTNLLRARRSVRGIDSTHVEIDSRRYVNFAANDYLGLTHHTRVVAVAKEAIEEDA